MTKHTILFLAANPLGTDRLALDSEARAIQAELERSGHRDRFELVTRWAAEPLDLLREMRKLKPTIVHFSGHGGRGKPDETRQAAGPRRDVIDAPRSEDGECQRSLFFHGQDGGPQLVSTAALEGTFGAAGASVKLVVLNACYSEVLAETLLAHVDCVVGMGGSILDDAARNFAIGFYGGLGERQSVADAYKQGCAAIILEGLRDAERPRFTVRGGIDADQLVLAAPPRLATRPASGLVLPFVAALAGLLSVGLLLHLIPEPRQGIDITVFLQDETGHPPPLLTPNRGRLSIDLGADRRTESVGDKGEVRFFGIPASMRGREAILVLTAEHYELANPGRQFRLNQEVLYVTVRVKQLRLAGNVSDSRGRPLSQARASIAGNVATTDRDGRFAMLLPANLPEGDRMITITASGYETWRAHVAPGGNPLQVRLSGAVEGR